MSKLPSRPTEKLKDAIEMLQNMLENEGGYSGSPLTWEQKAYLVCYVLSPLTQVRAYVHGNEDANGRARE